MTTRFFYLDMVLWEQAFNRSLITGHPVLEVHIQIGHSF